MSAIYTALLQDPELLIMTVLTLVNIAVCLCTLLTQTP